VERYLNLFRRHFPLIMPQPRVLDRALDLASRFSLSHWDAMLLAACKAAGVTNLYSEDMQDGMNYDGVTVTNPFT